MPNLVEVSADFKSEIIERIQTYLDSPEQVIDPNVPESQEDYNELMVFRDKHFDDNILDADICETFVQDLESSMRNYGETKGKMYRALCKFYVDSGLAVPVDVQAFKDGREWCSGGIQGVTWFTYNKTRYQAK